ncbi:hypothetical protein MSG28_014526 [Choristoneura fumiferana]|uniref:Uncharacterized protein n=1 Tax=Choristoneura fumiferana TaxID=7141 RepID=A0ACC0JRS0_CHOFU|nr:hypothetical protein MSG28_014526 [Choristoneura fumiferana]
MMSGPKNNGPIVDPALCRCCRAIKKCRILTAEYTWMGKKEIYADMVMDCYGILLSHVDDNERDSGVCATCVVRLREAIAFRHQVLQCEELFLQAKLEHHDEEEKDVQLSENVGRIFLFFNQKITKMKRVIVGSGNCVTSRRAKKHSKRGQVGSLRTKVSRGLNVYAPVGAETRLKKFDLELKTEPKDYNSDHNSLDDRDDPCPVYSDDDADDNKPLKKEVPKPEEPPPVKEDELKSEDSLDFHGDSSSDSDEPIKKKMKRKAKESKTKANGAKKKTGKAAKKQKAETGNTETDSSEKVENFNLTHQEDASNAISREISEPEVHMIIKVETSSETEIITETITSAEIGTHVVETTVPKPKKKKNVVIRPEGKTGYDMLCEELELSEELYFKHYNMSKESFDELFGILKASLERKERAFSKRFIEARQRYLKTGESVRLLGLYHGIGRSTAGQIIVQVCKAIWDILQPIVMPIPTEETWSRCEEGFRNTWNLPNCIGSLGGRHLIARRAEKDSGLNSSAVFIAIADPFGNLILIDVGNYGKMDEKDIFERTSFYKDFLCNKKLLPDKLLPYTNRYAPHVLIGSDGLPLKTYMLCEYPKLKALKDPASKCFNERVRVGRTVDRVFDMLMSNWRIFQHPMDSSLDTSLHMMRAVCCLHNYVRSRHGDLGVKDGVAKKGKKGVKALVPLRPSNRRATDAALKMREVFSEYFSSDTSDTRLVGRDVSGAEIESSQERSE